MATAEQTTVLSQPPSALSPLHGGRTAATGTGGSLADKRGDRRGECAVTPKATLHRPHDLGARLLPLPYPRPAPHPLLCSSLLPYTDSREGPLSLSLSTAEEVARLEMLRELMSKTALKKQKKASPSRQAGCVVPVPWNGRHTVNPVLTTIERSRAAAWMAASRSGNRWKT